MVSMADQQVLDDYDDLSIEETWDEHIPDSRHEEMLRQDRNRLIVAGVSGVAVALMLIGGAYTWVSTMRAPASGGVSAISAPVEISDSPEPLRQSAAIGSATNSAAKIDIEAKLRSLAPHEALAVSPDAQSGAKKVRAERIETKVD